MASYGVNEFYCKRFSNELSFTANDSVWFQDRVFLFISPVILFLVEIKGFNLNSLFEDVKCHATALKYTTNQFTLSLAQMCCTLI